MRYLILSLTIIFNIFSNAVMAESLRISPDELNKLLGSDIHIIDVRPKNDYDIAHIKGAINFPVNLTYSNKKINGEIVQPSQMQRHLRTLGLKTNSNIIVYDGGKLVDAARVFWAFEVYGLQRVKILDHGLNYWLNKDLPTEQITPNITPSQYVVRINHKRLSSKFTTQLATHNDKKLVIDARSYPAYIGETSVAKRFGHIPSAINVPFNHNINQTTEFSTLKPISELKKLYADVPHNKKIIIYCKIGRVSSTNYFALRELGHDVSNYDASWREWGNDDSLPIEK